MERATTLIREMYNDYLKLVANYTDAEICKAIEETNIKCWFISNLYDSCIENLEEE